MGVAFAAGAITHVLLFINGKIGSSALVATQLANAVLFLLMPWLGEKWRGGVLVRPVTV